MTAKCAFCNQRFTADKHTVDDEHATRESKAAQLCAMQFTHLSEFHKDEFGQTCRDVVQFNRAFSAWMMLSRNLTSADVGFQQARDGYHRQLVEMIGAARTAGLANGGDGQGQGGALLAKWW